MRPCAVQIDMSHWQVVWRYEDYQRVRLSSAEGAIALTPGSPGGAPVRLVDTFSSDGIMGGRFAKLSQGTIMAK